jgi:hypothetical protein
LAKIREDINKDPTKALEITNGEVMLTAGVDVLRWFDPFVEDIYECSEADIVKRVEVMSQAKGKEKGT